MRIGRVFLLAVMVCFALSGQAFAERYMTGKAGIFFPDEGGFDEGPNVEVALGWGMKDLSPQAVSNNPGLANVAVELGIGLYNSELERPGVDAEFTAMPLTLTGLLRVPLQQSPLEVYAGAGAGFYLVWLEVDTPFVGTDDDLELEFGLHGLVGAAVKVDERLSLLGELKANTVTEDVDGVFLNVGIRYTF